MSAMRSELSLMPLMVWTTCPTTSPPLMATLLAPCASWLA